jgi:putative hydrolase of HD superfamily
MIVILPPDIDRERCLRMALVHDLAECIVGDITPHMGISKEDKHRREMVWQYNDLVYLGL